VCVCGHVDIGHYRRGNGTFGICEVRRDGAFCACAKLVPRPLAVDLAPAPRRAVA